MNKQDNSFQDWIWRFVLHVLTGFLSVIVHYSIMALGLYYGLPALLASSIGFIGGAVSRFVTAYFKVFTPSNTVIRTIPRFCLVLAAQGLCNSLLLALLLATTLPVWWAQVCTTLLLTVFNYLAYRIWVFQ